MPERLLRRRWILYGAIGLLLGLAIATTVSLVLLYFVRGDVEQQKREGKLAEVATCYAAARGRPSLIVILRLISGIAGDQAERDVVDQFIDRYEGNTPTVTECDELAAMRGFSPEDFPAPEVPTERTARQERDEANGK